MKEILNSNELYSQRLLVFLETEPQSNKYHQIYLDAENFKRLTATLGTMVGKDGEIEKVLIEESTQIYNLPDLKEIN